VCDAELFYLGLLISAGCFDRGEVEWNGPWSDSSKEWKGISDRQKKKLGLVISDDGIFWMAYKDFYRVFNNVEIAHTPNTSIFSMRKTWHLYRFCGSWSGDHAGGCSVGSCVLHCTSLCALCVCV
jgi:Calpain family cysteine protease